VALEGHLMRLATITHSGGCSRTGELSLAGADASRLELVCVSGCTVSPSTGAASYTLTAGGSLKLMVVKKSDFASTLSATLEDDDGTGDQTIASITTTALGYPIIFWFNPRDITYANVTDSDASGTLSQSDALNTLPDRSGNGRHLTASASSGKATYVSSGNNAQPNIVMNATISTGTRYESSTSSIGFTSGQDLLLLLTAQTTQVTARQRLTMGKWPDVYNSFGGIEFNTYQTTGTHHECYIAGNSYDVTALDAQSHVNLLHMTDTTHSLNIASNAKYYVDQQEYSLIGRGLKAGGIYSNQMQEANQVSLSIVGTMYDAIIVDGAEVSPSERQRLRCYSALKNQIDSSDCQ